MLSKFSCFCVTFLCFTSHLNCHPVPIEDDENYIKSRLSNYQKRFTILAKNIDPKFAEDLELLVHRFNSISEKGDLEGTANFLESFMNQLDPAFSNYLQYELDAQLLDEDINIEIWFLEQLLPQIEDRELAADIKHLLSYYEIARNTRIIDKEFEVFSNIDNVISQRLLNFLDEKPTPTALLNVHLQLFREFLLHLLTECNVGEFKENIKNSLMDLEKALIENGMTYEQKEELLDRFDDVKSDFGKFLDAEVHGFEITKFGQN